MLIVCGSIVFLVRIVYLSIMFNYIFDVFDVDGGFG